MLRIFKSQIISYLTYVIVSEREPVFGAFHNVKRYDLLSSAACLFFHKIAEISRRQVHYTREMIDRRNPFAAVTVRVIRSQSLMKSRQQV